MRHSILQEGLAVASIARDDPSIGGGHVGDRMMASTSLAGAAAVFPACTVTTMHFRHRQTDRQTDTDIVA